MQLYGVKAVGQWWDQDTFVEAETKTEAPTPKAEAKTEALTRKTEAKTEAVLARPRRDRGSWSQFCAKLFMSRLVELVPWYNRHRHTVGPNSFYCQLFSQSPLLGLYNEQTLHPTQKLVMIVLLFGDLFIYRPILHQNFANSFQGRKGQIIVEYCLRGVSN